MPSMPPTHRPRGVPTRREKRQAFDAKRTAEKPWRRWYWTARWRRRSRAQLEAQPLCERCLAEGLVTPATVAHHKVAPRGDPVLFWEGELASSCAPHHDRDEQREEHAARRG